MPIGAESIQIARLEEQFSSMRRTMEDVSLTLRETQKQLADVKTQLEQARGGWRTLLWLGGAGATLGGFLTWAAGHVTLR